MYTIVCVFKSPLTQVLFLMQERHKSSPWSHTPSSSSTACPLLRLLWVTKLWMLPTSWSPHLSTCTRIFPKRRPLGNTAVLRARSTLKPLTQVVVDVLCCSHLFCLLGGVYELKVVEILGCCFFASDRGVLSSSRLLHLNEYALS